MQLKHFAPSAALVVLAERIGFVEPYDRVWESAPSGVVSCSCRCGCDVPLKDCGDLGRAGQCGCGRIHFSPPVAEVCTPPPGVGKRVGGRMGKWLR